MKLGRPISSDKYAAVWARNKALGRRQPCECGCREMATLRFVSGHNMRLMPKEEQSRRGRMNDGSKQRDRGSGNWYRKVRGRHEHRIVIEEMLGRPLRSDEIVHHKNKDVRDNRPENLEVMTRSEHARLHFSKHGGSGSEGDSA